MKLASPYLFAGLFLLGAACSRGTSALTAADIAAAGDPAEVALGERLFRETRFAQLFAQQNPGNLTNFPIFQSDPILDTSETLATPLPGPYQGKSMNCAACHLVDEQLGQADGGMRTYSDFARRSPVSERTDGKQRAPRNSPPLVNSALARTNPFLLHFDGEFTSIEDLVRGTLTGRNFGWLPGESSQAIAQIAQVIRMDSGKGELAEEFGSLPYRIVLGGTDLSIPKEFVLPESFRIDANLATDSEILDAVAALIGSYVESLVFSQDDDGAFNGSPFDLFLIRNNLSRLPDAGDSDVDYSRKLLTAVNALATPSFVSEGSFKHHNQAKKFGAIELEGLKIFLAEPSTIPPDAPTLAQGRVGNCVVCHPAPSFSDFSFHNVGVAQSEYDLIHGGGAFLALSIPDLATRNASFDSFLPPSENHPNANGRFRDIPTIADASRADLGLWNVVGNADIPGPESAIEQILCPEFGLSGGSCNATNLLPLTVAYFKTPGLRDLGHSAPYFHNGQKDALADVLLHYIEFSDLARQSLVLNASEEISGIALTTQDLDALVAFLRSLNEDYE